MASSNRDGRAERRSAEVSGSLHSHTLTTVRRSLEVLELVVMHPGRFTAKGLARHLATSLSTVYHVINTLEDVGFVQPSCHGGGLEPGPAMTRLRRWMHDPASAAERLKPLLREISDQTETPSYLAIWDDGDLQIVEVQGRTGARELPDLRKGFRGAAHALALGKVFLAHLDRSQWPSYVRQPVLKSFTDHTIRDPTELARNLAAVRRLELATDREEFASGMCCIAVPLYSDERCVAAVGISLSGRRFLSEGSTLTHIIRDVVGHR
jgi:DNA-binding IclR family transcriptional regulator